MQSAPWTASRWTYRLPEGPAERAAAIPANRAPSNTACAGWQDAANCEAEAARPTRTPQADHLEGLGPQTCGSGVTFPVVPDADSGPEISRLL